MTVLDISNVQFSSLLAYTPRGKSTKHVESMAYMRKLKNSEDLGSGSLMSEQIAKTIRDDLMKYPFYDYFHKSTILVPIPSRSLSRKDGSNKWKTIVQNASLSKVNQ